MEIWAGCLVLLSSGLLILEHGQDLPICVIIDCIRRYCYGALHCNTKIKNWNFRIHTKFKELDMEYLCNTDMILFLLLKILRKLVLIDIRESGMMILC